MRAIISINHIKYVLVKNQPSFMNLTISHVSRPIRATWKLIFDGRNNERIIGSNTLFASFSFRSVEISPFFYVLHLWAYTHQFFQLFVAASDRRDGCSVETTILVVYAQMIPEWQRDGMVRRTLKWRRWFLCGWPRFHGQRRTRREKRQPEWI